MIYIYLRKQQSDDKLGGNLAQGALHRRAGDQRDRFIFAASVAGMRRADTVFCGGRPRKLPAVPAG